MKQMMSFRGQATWAKLIPPMDKITAPVCLPSKKVNKAEKLALLSINIGQERARPGYVRLE